MASAPEIGLREWSNWPGSLRFQTQRIAAPAYEQDLAQLVRQASQMGESVRVVGSGPSSSPDKRRPRHH